MAHDEAIAAFDVVKALAIDGALKFAIEEGKLPVEVALYPDDTGNTDTVGAVAPVDGAIVCADPKVIESAQAKLQSTIKP